jgi:hypothetical protein
MKNYYPKLSKVNIIAILAFFVCTILLLGFSYAKPSLYSISSLEFRGVSYNLSWYNKASVQKSSIEGKVGQVDFAAAVSELIIDNKNKEL